MARKLMPIFLVYLVLDRVETSVLGSNTGSLAIMKSLLSVKKFSQVLSSRGNATNSSAA